MSIKEQYPVRIRLKDETPSPPAEPKKETEPSPTEPKDKSMAKTALGNVKQAGVIIGNRAALGAAQAVIGETNKEIVRAIKRMAGDSWPEQLQGDAAEAVLASVIPSLMILVLQMDTNNTIPANIADRLQLAAELGVQHVSADATVHLMTLAKPLLQQIISGYNTAGTKIEKIMENPDSVAPAFDFNGLGIEIEEAVEVEA